MISPSNNATDYTIDPTFVWSGDPHAVSYEILVGSDMDALQQVKSENGDLVTDFTGAVFIGVTFDTYSSITGTLEYSQDYYWMVRGENPVVGLEGTFSEIRKFTTQAEPVDTVGQFGNFTYVDNGTYITITDYPENSTGAVNIPSTINGKPVISIGSSAFRDCSGLTSVTIPSSVTRIDFFAFYRCSGLVSVTIPSSVTNISSYAFSNCDGLTSFDIGAANINYSSRAGVLFNKSQTLLIQYPAGLSGDYTVPSSVTSIGERAFYGCDGLTSVTIPTSVSSIGELAFSSCDGLTSFDISAANINYSSRAGVLFNKSQTLLIQYPAGLSGDYTVPSSVTNIGERAFYFCHGLANVTIPSSVSIIGERAFYYCKDLTSVTIPSSVTSIGDSAFILCFGLSDAIFMGNAPSTIGLDIFKYTDSDFTVYYLNGSTGFSSPTWLGYPAVEWQGSTSDPIAAISLVSPFNNSTGYTRDPAFVWNADSRANTYRILVGTDLATLQQIKSENGNPDPDFTGAVFMGVTSETYSPISSTLDYNKDYYWMVRGGNSVFGLGGYFSEIRRFTTESPANTVPSLQQWTAPRDGAAGDVLTLSAQWTDADSDSIVDAKVRYRLAGGAWVEDSMPPVSGSSPPLFRKDITLNTTGRYTVEFQASDADPVSGEVKGTADWQGLSWIDVYDADDAQLVFTQEPSGDLVPGQVVPISYTASYPGEVRIAALRLSDGQSQIGGFLTDDQSNLNVTSFSHTYNWTVPADLPSGTYRVELITYLNGTSAIPNKYSAAFTVTNDVLSSFEDYEGHLMGNPSANGVATPTLGLGVNAANGNFFYAEVDVAPVPGNDIPFAFVRYYNSLSPENDLAGDPIVYPFGHGWTCSYDVFLTFSGNLAEIRWPDGRRDGFERANASLPWSGVTPGNFHFLEEDGSGGWIITTPQSERFYFNASGLLSEIKSVNNYSISIAYQSTRRTITDSAGREFILRLNGGLATSLDLPDGTNVEYGYEPATGLFGSVIDRASKTRQYNYLNGRLNRVRYREALNENGAVVFNSYDEDGRVVEQKEAIHLTSGSLKHSFDWDTESQVQYQSPKLEQTTVFKDSLGRARSISEWSPDVISASTVATITYQAADGPESIQPDTIVGANSQDTTYEFAGAYPQSISDPVDRTATYDYSRTGLQRHLPNSMGTAAGAQLTFVSSGNNIGSVSVTQPASAQDLSPTVNLAMTYDGGLLETLTKGGSVTKTEVVGRDIYGNPTTLRYYTNVSSNSYILETRTYDVMSRLTSTSDSTGLRVYYFYDGEGRLTDLVSGPGTGYTSGTPASASIRHQRWEYDAEGRVEKIYDGWGSSAVSSTSYDYNSTGLLYRVTNSDGAATNYRYNEDSEVIRVEDEKLDRVDKVAHQESYRVRNVELASSYSGTGSTPKRVVGSKMDASGRVIESYIGTSMDSNGDVANKQRLATYTYDKLDRPLQINRYEEYSGGIQLRRESYSYSADGRITTISYYDSRSGNLAESKTVENDASGKPIKVTVSRSGQSFTSTAKYNAAGQLVETADPSNNKTTYQRDGLGRILSKSDVRGTYTWSYNDAARSVTRTAPDSTTVTTVTDVHGQPVSITGTGINFSFTYDSRGRALTEAWTGGSRTYAYTGNFVDFVSTQFATGSPMLIDYTWNKQTGQLSRQDYAGKRIDYSYNGFSDVIGMAVKSEGGSTLFGNFAFDYDDTRGTLKEITYPNGIHSQYSWNLVGELSSLKTFRTGESSNPFVSYDLTMDGLGRRTRIGFKQPEGVVFPDESTSLTHTNGVLTKVAGSNVTADGRKNLTNIPGHAGISYDLLDRVASVGTTTHDYDAARNRMETTRGGTKVRYLQDVLSGLPSVVATMNGSNQVDTTFIHGPGGLLGGITASGEWEIAHQDFNSNVIAVTNASAEITSSFAYTPYGRSAGATGDTSFPFQFSGGVGVVTDPEGLVHMRARSYSPLVRQFTSGDLIAGQLSKPMSMGRFNFLEGMAMGGVDPSGLVFGSLGEWIHKVSNGKQRRQQLDNEQLRNHLLSLRNPEEPRFRLASRIAMAALSEENTRHMNNIELGYRSSKYTADTSYYSAIGVSALITGGSTVAPTLKLALLSKQTLSLTALSSVRAVYDVLGSESRYRAFTGGSNAVGIGLSYAGSVVGSLNPGIGLVVEGLGTVAGEVFSRLPGLNTKMNSPKVNQQLGQ
ncbi:MAG: leucine-rich repeat protein [Luteolibacter sp.]